MAQPTAFEQYMLELLNRARSDPAGEAARLGIDLNQGLPAGTITATPKQPLAFNMLLIDAARAHSDWMLATDIFSHTGVNGSSPGDRMAAAGYPFTGSWSWGENIATQYGSRVAVTQNVTQTLEDGLFRSPGHRENILAGHFREIGIGITQGEFQGTTGVMATQNFARTGSAYFILGVGFQDRDGDRFYDVGEGVGGITVQARSSSGQIYSTTSWDAGGYQMALPQGSYTLTFSGGGLAAPVTRQAVVQGANVKIDLDFSTLTSAPVAGTEELLLRAASGQVLAWDTTRGAEGFTSLAGFNATTSVRGTGDFNADGRDDMLLSVGGGSHVWWDIAKGGQGFAVLPDFAGFQAVGTGNFTGSAADDILLRDAGGRMIFLDVAGGNRSVPFLTLSQGFSFVATGELDGAGSREVIFQNGGNGALLAWTGNGFRDLIQLAPGSGWGVQAVGNFIGGGTDDLLLRNTVSGTMIFWDPSQGSAGFQDFVTPAPGWSVAGTADLNGDGRDDVLFRNQASGQSVYWTGSGFADLGDVLAGVQLVGMGDVG
ncbi:MAG TPA: CAP domain-containing protein [Azospirillaceae bacterium]|nr:CAP domain-containing protein [Azospirillaceae bacterium]